MQKIEKWSEIYVQLMEADQNHALEPPELERFALAAYLTGRDAQSFQVLERAHQRYLDQGAVEKAVRCAFWLGLMFMNMGEMARSAGWIAKAERLLSNEQGSESVEKGLLMIPRALGELSAGNGSKAQEIFELAVSFGEQFQNMDLIALGRLGLGQSFIQQGEITRGIKFLDETMITIETEEVFPLVNGIIYCAVIEMCRKVWDLERAQEWTSSLTRWCEAQPDIVPFRGQCLVRRAEIFQFHGDWTKALEETIEACTLLTRDQGEPAAGEAYYRQAELYRLTGNFKKAEDCYHEAAKRGRKPQPGLALLRLVQGKHDPAATAIRNTLQETKDLKRRAELLPAAVSIMLAAEQTGEAEEAAEELNAIARDFNVSYLLAMSAYCQGAVFHAKGNFELALEQLQKALILWDSLNLPYETACARELKGLAYLKLGDPDNSEAEWIAARWIFEQLRAIPDLERVNRLSSRKGNHETFGLTLRELQVLQWVASGKTNKLIASKLFISERTIERHLSNIFNKLQVNSRTEAATFAYKHQIL